MLMTQAYKKAAVRVAFLLCILMFSSCTSDGARRLSPFVSQSQPYKHMLSLSGDMAAELSTMIEKSNWRKNVVLLQAPEPSALQMRADLVIDAGHIASQAPAMAGRLARKSVRPLYTLSYTLMGADGKMLSATDVTHRGEARDMYFPNLDDRLLALTQNDKKTLLNKLSKSLLPSIQAQKWRTSVLAVVPQTHIVIAGGKRVGFHYGDTFQTETQPVGTFQVVNFETTPEGLERTTLRLISGQLPAVGRTLVPVK